VIATTVVSHAKAVSEAAPPQSDATDRAAHESAVAGATPAIAPDHPFDEMNAKMVADVAATEAEVVTTEGAVATTVEEAETTVPVLAIAHHNHQKAPELAAPAPHLAESPSLPLVLASQPTRPSRKRRPMWR